MNNMVVNWHTVKLKNIEPIMITERIMAGGWSLMNREMSKELRIKD